MEKKAREEKGSWEHFDFSVIQKHKKLTQWQKRKRRRRWKVKSARQHSAEASFLVVSRFTIGFAFPLALKCIFLFKKIHFFDRKTFSHQHISLNNTKALCHSFKKKLKRNYIVRWKQVSKWFAFPLFLIFSTDKQTALLLKLSLS